MVEFSVGDATTPPEQFLLLYKARCDLKFLERVQDDYRGDEDFKAVLFHCKVFLGLEQLRRVPCILCEPINLFLEWDVVNEKTEGFHCAAHADLFHATRSYFTSAYCCDRYHPDKRYDWRVPELEDTSATSRARSPT
jgi:hypothetical protein